MPDFINNIGSLRYDLREHGWHMTAFDFEYNDVDYDVLFEDLDNMECRPDPYASVLLTFIDVNEPTRTYEVGANQVRFFFVPREFREFFRIRYCDNLGDVFRQFFNRFLDFVPEHAPLTLDDRKNHEIDATLGGRGGHDPNAIYCYDARRLGVRNGRQMHRSIFISNLIERRKPNLYNYFINEPTVTFYFSPNKEDEVADIEIINRFIARESSRRH